MEKSARKRGPHLGPLEGGEVSFVRWLYWLGVGLCCEGFLVWFGRARIVMGVFGWGVGLDDLCFVGSVSWRAGVFVCVMGKVGGYVVFGFVV